MIKIKCFACMDTGHAIIKKKKIVTAPSGKKQELFYDFALHCDQCEKGEEQKIDYTNKNKERFYSEPISKYYNIHELIQQNKKIYENRKSTQQIKEEEYIRNEREGIVNE